VKGSSRDVTSDSWLKLSTNFLCIRPLLGCAVAGLKPLRLLHAQRKAREHCWNDGIQSQSWRALLGRTPGTYVALPIQFGGHYSDGALHSMEVRDMCLLEVVSPRMQTSKVPSRQSREGKKKKLPSSLSTLKGGLVQNYRGRGRRWTVTWRKHKLFPESHRDSKSPSVGALRVEFLLKTESGYLRDAEVTLFTLANP